jgi:threonine synthase
LSAGAIPFCCQGPDNGLTIEGGKTLAYEVIDALGRDELARVFLQVGGGAFASAFSQACREARRATALPRLPRIHPVQTRGAFPLRRAYDALVDTLVQRATPPGPRPAARTADVAEWMRRHVSDAVLQRALDGAARRRHAFMRPWETEPRSIARGILDDETYDWLEIVKGTIEGGGWPLVVTEDELARANELARAATGSDVDHTGSAGLAGIVHVIATDPATLRALRDEHVVVVFTGARRGA